MTLILAESLQLNLETREPDYYSEAVAGASTLKFGVQNPGAIDPSLLIGSDVTPRPDKQYSGHDKTRPWGAINRPLEW